MQAGYSHISEMVCSRYLSPECQKFVVIIKYHYITYTQLPPTPVIIWGFVKCFSFHKLANEEVAA